MRNRPYETRQGDQVYQGHSQGCPYLQCQRLNCISNEDMKVRMTSVAKNLFNVDGSGIPSINRRDTLTSTENGVRNPGREPPSKMGQTNRGPDDKLPVEHIKGADQWGTIALGLGNHSNIRIEKFLRPLTNSFNLAKN